MIHMTKLFFLFLISIFSSAAIAQDVAQWRGPNRDGIYTETGLLKKWPEAGPRLCGISMSLVTDIPLLP